MAGTARRARRVAIALALCVLLALTSHAHAYKFGAAAKTNTDVEVVREDTSEVREADSGSVIERASSTSISRPVTADEEVEKELAELRANQTSSSASSTGDHHETPTPVPTSKKPTKKPTVPPTPTSTRTPTPTPTESKSKTDDSSSSASSSSGSVLSADELSAKEQAEAARHANSSLDKTVVVVIVGIVAAIGVTALLVSRQIKNMIDGESDDEL